MASVAGVKTRSPWTWPARRRSAAAAEAASTRAGGTGDLDAGERGAHGDLRLGLRAADADQGGGDGVEQGGVGVDLEAVVA